MEAGSTQARREAQAERLKERVYIAFATLAVLVALGSHEVAPLDALWTVLITVLGTVMAVFTAGILSHLVAHSAYPNRAEMRQGVSASFGAAGAVVAPAILLIGAALGWWPTRTALIAGLICVVAGLVLVAYLSVRRLPLTTWQRVAALAMEALLSLVVIGIQVLAHGG